MAMSISDIEEAAFRRGLKSEALEYYSKLLPPDINIPQVSDQYFSLIHGYKVRLYH